MEANEERKREKRAKNKDGKPGIERFMEYEEGFRDKMGNKAERRNCDLLRRDTQQLVGL